MVVYALQLSYHSRIASFNRKTCLLLETHVHQRPNWRA